ncbi:NAD(P)-binding protein [Auricularia subglabra TFB-10046 SS5]|nr:NAD(P)-binding protein [Auricularia subglabra TFB-10046 SS5]
MAPSASSASVFLTGASRGIGLAIAEQLLAADHRVATFSRSLTPELKALGDRYPSTLQIIQGDAADPNATSKAVSDAAARFGGLDSLILNSALGTKGTVRNTPLNEWKDCFGVNVFGMLPIVQTALPFLDKSKRGARIVLLSSGGGVTPGGGLAPYSASKAAVNSLARSLGVEEPSITTIAVHPGMVVTEMLLDMANAKGVVSEQFRDLFNTGIAALEDPTRSAQYVAITPKVSAERLVWLALNMPKEFSGRYIDAGAPEILGLVYAA